MAPDCRNSGAFSCSTNRCHDERLRIESPYGQSDQGGGVIPADRDHDQTRGGHIHAGERAFFLGVAASGDISVGHRAFYCFGRYIQNDNVRIRFGQCNAAGGSAALDAVSTDHGVLAHPFPPGVFVLLAPELFGQRKDRRGQQDRQERET